jgi:LacI family transcriptional regulator
MVNERSGAVTIATIAQEAGVSVPTVSRVLNRRSDVAPGTRERVERLLQESGYRRRGAQASGAGLIDLVFDDLDSPWAIEVMRGVEDAAHAAGVGTVLTALHRQAGSTRQWLSNLRARASNGAVLVTTGLDPLLQEELRSLHVPAVVIDPAGVPALDVPTIAADNFSGAVVATEHLVALGHRRIAHVAGRPTLWCSRARLDGYRSALQSAGLPFDPELVVEGNFDFESGFRAGRRLLELASPPTAIFAASDQMALGVTEALRRARVSVPDDMSVVGFDDLPVVRWSSPPLTTVNQPLVAMGRLAVHTVLRLVSGERLESTRVELATTLVIRDSTAPPRPAAEVG